MHGCAVLLLAGSFVATFVLTWFFDADWLYAGFCWGLLVGAICAVAIAGTQRAS